MEKIMELKQKRAALVKQARELIEVAEKENRSVDEEQYNRIDKEIDVLGEQIKREERLYALESELEQRGGVTFKQNPNEQRNVQGNEEYRNAFWKAMRHTRNALDATEYRSLSAGVDTEGGYTVPDEFEKTLIQKLHDTNIIRGLATITTSSGDKNIPVVSGFGSATWTGENAAYTESDNAFDVVTLSAYKLTTLMKVSEELLNDSAFDLEAFISSEYARRIGEAEENAFIVGDGTGKPTGIITSAQVGKTATVANAITFDEIIDLFHSLRRPYRQRATFLMSDNTMKVIRKIKDGNGQYIYQPSVQAGQPDRLLGRPIAISDFVPEIGASSKPIAFGDLSYYQVCDRQGKVFQRLNELYAVNGQVGFRAYQRVDGKLTLPEAVKVLQMAAV
jgi:HK97 family phage major capsid protein